MNGGAGWCRINGFSWFMEIEMNEPKSKGPEPYPAIDALECKACGRCVASCPKKVIEMGQELNARGYAFAKYVGAGCIGCLNCFYSCPEPNAIAVHVPAREPAKRENG